MCWDSNTGAPAPHIYIYIYISATVPLGTCSVFELIAFSFLWFWFWFWSCSGSGLGLVWVLALVWVWGPGLGLSWWEEALPLGPTHFSPLLPPHAGGAFGLLFGLPFFFGILTPSKDAKKSRKEAQGSQKPPKMESKVNPKGQKIKVLGKSENLPKP